MKRREFITLLGSTALAWPLAARAQQAGGMRRIGILMPFPKGDAEAQARVQAFRQELARLGWSEGSNVKLDERWSTYNLDLVRADAANLVALNPDVIVCQGDRVIPIPDKIYSFHSDCRCDNQRSDRVRCCGKSRASGRQRDWIFIHRVLDVWKDVKDIEEACSRYLPRRHDI